MKAANAEMVARLMASRGLRRDVTEADVLAQVQAAAKSVATSAPPPKRGRQVRCECGLWRDEGLAVHSPRAKAGFIVDCMGRVLR